MRGSTTLPAALIAAIASTTLVYRPAATAPSSADPSNTASGSRANTTRQPQMSACSRKNNGFFVSPPHASSVSI